MISKLISEKFKVLSNEEMRQTKGGSYCVCWQDYGRSEGADGSYFMAFFESAEDAMRFANRISCYSSVKNVSASIQLEDVVVTR